MQLVREIRDAENYLDRVTKIAQALPKYHYTKRKNGKKKKILTSAIRRGNKKEGGIYKQPAMDSKGSLWGNRAIIARLNFNRLMAEWDEMVADANRNFTYKKKHETRSIVEAMSEGMDTAQPA
jgi:hypothetical protein